MKPSLFFNGGLARFFSKMTKKSLFFHTAITVGRIEMHPACVLILVQIQDQFVLSSEVFIRSWSRSFAMPYLAFVSNVTISELT